MKKHLLIFNGVQGKEKTVEVNLLDTENAAQVYRAINNKFRQQILKFIEENAHVNVTTICHYLKLKQPEVSLHLAVLRKAGFVSASREGKYMLYMVNRKRMEELNRSISILLKQEIVRTTKL